MLLSVSHQTEYVYSQAQRRISQSHRLYPTECNAQRVLSWEVSVERGEFGSYFFDGAGDRIRTMSLAESTDEIKIMVKGEVDTTYTTGLMQCPRDVVSPLVYLRSTPVTAPDEALHELARSCTTAHGANRLDQAHALSRAVLEAIVYAPGATNPSSSAGQALALGAGVCQDHAHCLISIARLCGIPARYIVGYLHTDASLQSHDSSHAWVEMYIDYLGWVGFDATNQCCPDERYIRIGSGLDAEAAAPVRGIAYGAGGETMQTRVSVTGNQQ